LADQITARKGRLAKRAEVMNAFVSEGGNPNTASTQYSQWRADSERREASRSVVARSDTTTLTIAPDGRLLIPLEWRRRMMIGPDGRVSASFENGELRLMAPLAALRRLQEVVKQMDRGQGSVVAELIADRRAESQLP
jgi:hypothetical protein